MSHCYCWCCCFRITTQAPPHTGPPRDWSCALGCLILGISTVGCLVVSLVSQNYHCCWRMITTTEGDADTEWRVAKHRAKQSGQRESKQNTAVGYPSSEILLHMWRICSCYKVNNVWKGRLCHCFACFSLQVLQASNMVGDLLYCRGVILCANNISTQ